MARLSAGVLLVAFASTLWAQQPASKSKFSFPDGGAVRDGVYRNIFFGFSYKLPYGWVDRTADMQDDTATQSRVLMAIFERPPQASGETINSAVVIAAEPIPAGIKTAAEYSDSLSALTTAKGFNAEEGPREFSVGVTRLLRGDFSRARGTLTIRQSSLVSLQKGYAVSFTFIAGSGDDVNELVERLSFAARKSAH